MTKETLWSVVVGVIMMSGASGWAAEARLAWDPATGVEIRTPVATVWWDRNSKQAVPVLKFAQGEVPLKNRDVIGFYSDYTPQAFTPEEWRIFTRLSVESGIRSMPLPHLSRTWGVALQQRWGDDYTVHYYLKHPAKGVMVFELQALLPMMQAVYEEGGCPGVIWADYTCDVFVTETQKRELKLLRNAMEKKQMTGCKE